MEEEELLSRNKILIFYLNRNCLVGAGLIQAGWSRGNPVQ